MTETEPTLADGITYMTYFDTDTDAEALRRVLTTAFAMPADRVYVGLMEHLGDRDGPLLHVLIEVPEEPGLPCVLTGGNALARACGGMTELELAQWLCPRLGTSAFVSNDSPCAVEWYYVGTDGVSSRVIADEDAVEDGRLVVAHSYDPIPSRPDVAVIEPPEWSSCWR
ncbi:hypothetical protein [Stackebrandtia soli]|uniref:hypothetical protein n=1 Tax=Stackebrandtia soli TaxID=1892856 RepID=UPI0039EA7099